MQVPKRKSEMDRLAGRQEDHYMTAEKVRRLKADLEDLERVQRPKAVEDLTKAREMGDLSENAAYTEAKARLGRIDGRVLSIKDRLKNAIIIETGADPSGKIRIGSTVVLMINGNRRTYQILGSQETNPAAGRISHLSPLGKALIDRRAGETVTVAANGRDIVYTIVEVK
ncbi:transcription elongation factor GreA [Candidatus Uhrbacteria bacterium]|nr:transcription elongation factor GreA [Candidatus Uhrbacteria bacterium]